MSLDYSDKREVASERTVSPLGLYYWGSVWTLGAWCELRQGYRNFRLDRITHLETTDTEFLHESPRTLTDYVRAMRSEDT